MILFPVHVFDNLNQTKFDIEYRTRFERRLDKDFSKSNRDNRTDLFQRLRVGMKVEGNDHWTGFAQFQFGHDLITTSQKNSSDESRDLLQVYAQRQVGDNKLTVGRQKINLGSERLIGSLEWINRSRSFDAFRYQTPKFDAFAASIGIQNLQPQQARIGVISVNQKNGAVSLIFKHDKAPQSIDHWTLDESARGSLAGLEYDFDGALQKGSNGGKDVDAWAAHLQVAKKLGSKSRAGLEWNGASGGTSATKVRTFDNLYPTNHKFYGLMDMHAWKNLNQVAFTLSNKARADVDVNFRVAKNWLQDSKDAWYGATGVPNRYAGGAFVATTGASGKDLGMEWDLETNWKKSSKESVLFGLGYYEPGHFVSNLSGSGQGQVFTCLQYSLKF